LNPLGTMSADGPTTPASAATAQPAPEFGLDVTSAENPPQPADCKHCESGPIRIARGLVFLALTPSGERGGDHA